MKRVKVYTLIVAWTSPVLLVLTWLMLLTGLGTFKGTLLSRATLGLLRGATAGKLHTVWLPLAVGLLSYLHGILGLQLLLHRWRLIKHKTAWEVGLFVLGAILLLQFLLLYWG
jgi:hypothetical protein